MFIFFKNYNLINALNFRNEIYQQYFRTYAGIHLKI